MSRGEGSVQCLVALLRSIAGMITHVTSLHVTLYPLKDPLVIEYLRQSLINNLGKRITSLKILSQLSVGFLPFTLRFNHNGIKKRCEGRYQRLDIVEFRPPHILQPFITFETFLNGGRYVLFSHLRLGEQPRVSINYIN